MMIKKKKAQSFFYTILNYAVLFFVFIACSDHPKNKEARWPGSFGFGHAAPDSLIKKMDNDVRPDGKGLPFGSGSVAEGAVIYQVKCAACHGENGKEGPQSRLVAPMGDFAKEKAIGNYWPYSTTLFDYIKRAMPFNAPGSLSDNEVYAVSAYLLWKNKIIDSALVLNASNLYKIKMPAQGKFGTDDRKGGNEIK